MPIDEFKKKRRGENIIVSFFFIKGVEINIIILWCVFFSSTHLVLGVEINRIIFIFFIHSRKTDDKNKK